MTLRARVLVGMGTVAVVLIVAAVLIAGFTHTYLLGQIDDQLRLPGPARSRFTQVPPLAGLGVPDDRPPPDDAGSPALSAFYLAIVTTEGEVQELRAPDVSTDTSSEPDIDPERAVAEGEAAEPAPYTVSSVDGDDRFRVIALNDPASGNTLVVGRSLAELEAAMNRLIVVEVVAVGAVLAVLALVSVWVVRHGVRPLKQMTATATAIAGGDLSHRVESAHTGTEAAELGDALNTMLGRIQDAFEERAQSEHRLRQFVADASHELRTPVTSIRGYAELYRRGGLSHSNDLQLAMNRVEQEATRMGALIDDLLLLARLDQGRPLAQTPVDLGELAADSVRDAGALASNRTITLHAEERVDVVGDEHRLRQVVANLVTNAVAHTPSGTTVHVRAECRNGRRIIEVDDDGPGMAPEIANHAFERFWRADPSRSRHRGGAGLGLAIVKAIVEAHGGDVELRTVAGRGTTVTVTLPGPAT